MADYTITINAEQDALLTWIVTQHNKQLDDTSTNQSFVQSAIPALLAPYASQYKAVLRAQVETAFSNAVPQVQARVLNLLGIT